MRPDDAIDRLNHHFDTALSALCSASAPRLAVACSGGADSLALSLLAQSWVARRGGTLHALVIDHGLRRESAEECDQTLRWLAAQGIAAHILHLTPRPAETTGSPQAWARAARYDAMHDWCAARGLQQLLIGHHQDDQAETFLMRLLRQSGPEGLAAMSMRRSFREVELLRPLLGVPKATLEHYLHEQGQPWIQDPSNAHDAYLRTRMRRFLATHLSASQRERLVRLIARFGNWRAQQEVRRLAHLARHVTQHPLGHATLHPGLWQTVDDAEAITCLHRVLMVVDGRTIQPRREEVARLLTRLRQEPARPTTLHRCVWLPQSDGAWLVGREIAHAAPPIALASQGYCIWDARFAVDTRDISDTLSIGVLGTSGRRWLCEHAPACRSLPASITEAWPAIWHLEAPLAVPYIYLTPQEQHISGVAIRHAPAKGLAEAPFFTMNVGEEN